MPDKSREQIDLPKTSGPATDALLGAGYNRLEDFTKATEAEIAGLHGMGPKALRILKAAMADRNLAFAMQDIPKIGGPAMLALQGAGYDRLEDLTKATEAEVMGLHGMGPKAMEKLKAAMNERSLKFATKK